MTPLSPPPGVTRGSTVPKAAPVGAVDRRVKPGGDEKEVRRTIVGPLLAVLTASAPALAQERPPLLPTRDVTVVYQLSGDAGQAIPGGIPGTVRVSWSAAAQRLRAEPEGRGQALLLDFGAHSLEVVDSNLKTAMSLPLRERDLQPMTLQGAHLTRAGHAVIAGIGCTDYSAQSARGHGTVCVTPDGVALRASGVLDGRQGSFTAISVDYGPVPARALEVPKGYMNLDFLRMGNPK